MLKQFEIILLIFIAIGGIDVLVPNISSSAKLGQRSIKQLPVQPFPATPQIVKGDILVNFKLPPLPRPLDEKVLSERMSELRRLGNQLASTHKAQLHDIYSAVGTILLKASPGMVDSIISLLKKDPSTIAFATPNYRIYGFSSPPPSDSKWINDELWNLEKIGMKQVWDSGLVESDILIAVIDSGIDYTHPDLKDNMWTNPAPSAIGDVHGASYCDGNESGDPMDDPGYGHGTHVAGIIAARGENWTDNATDLVGVNWRAKLMAVKVLCKDSDGGYSGTLADAIAGIDYALQKNAAILNTSWGFSALDSYDIGILKAVIDDANTQNVLIVASAGNSNRDIGSFPRYPASITADNVIAVAASTSNDHLWAGTNFGGTAVHLAAPGEYIVSAFPGADFAEGSGTSAAAPHVAGCAALLQAKRLKSSLSLLTPRELRLLLMESGDDMGSDRTISGRRLNCSNAMDRFPPAIPTNLRVQ